MTLLLLSLPATSFAGELETLREKLIGSTVKTFAKTYIATTNLKKFKEKNIKKLNKMDEQKFQRVYNKIYQEMMKDLPQSLKDSWGVEEQMTRAKAIERINSFKNKRQIYRLINAIPNPMIARHYQKHREEFKKNMKEKKVDQVVDDVLADPAPSPI